MIVSVRFRKDERDRLKALRAERGCPSISALIRQSLGLEFSSTPDGIEAEEGEIQELAQLVRLMTRLIERVDDQVVLTKRMARGLGLKGLLMSDGETVVYRGSVKKGEPETDEAEAPVKPGLKRPDRKGEVADPVETAGFTR